MNDRIKVPLKLRRVPRALMTVNRPDGGVEESHGAEQHAKVPRAKQIHSLATLLGTILALA